MILLKLIGWYLCNEKKTLKGGGEDGKIRTKKRNSKVRGKESVMTVSRQNQS